MIRSFCTYFDHRYLSRGLAMFRSLKNHCPSARLWVLCLSTECHRALTVQALPDLIPVALEDFERGDDRLLEAKANRSAIEYYFTCTPSLPLYLFKQNPGLDTITYIDADLYFFGSPEPIFDEIGSSPIAITPHRFPQQHKWMEQNGVFNVGWLTFRRNGRGLSCLEWWRDRCLEWCRDYIDGDRFADQKYLDRFPKLFPGCHIIEHKGANLAAWNLGNYRLSERGGQLLVDEAPVIFYHFHGLKKVAPGVIDPSFAYYGLRLSSLMKARLFRPYFQSVAEAQSLVRAPGIESLKRKSGGGSRRPAAAQFIAAYAGLLTRRCLLSTLAL